MDDPVADGALLVRFGELADGIPGRRACHTWTFSRTLLVALEISVGADAFGQLGVDFADAQAPGIARR